MSPAHERRWLATILVAGLVFRFVFAAWVVGLGTLPKADEADYHGIAAHLAAGDGFLAPEGTPTARRPPAYPVFLAGLYAVTGADPVAGRLAQVLLGATVIFLTWHVARRLFGAGVAIVSAALVALNPFLIFISGYLLTENLFLVLLLGAFALLPAPRAWATASWRRVTIVGALLGLATLTRPSGLPMLEWMLVATLLLAGGAWKARGARVAVAALAALLVVAPWYARNARVAGGWVLTTHGGITFYQGNNHKVHDIPQWRGGAAPLESLPRFNELVAMSEIERDRLAWKMGKAYARTQWREMPELIKWKLIRFWRFKSDMGLSGIQSGWWFSKDSFLGKLAAEVDVGLVYAGFVMPLFLVGLAMTVRRARDLVFLYGAVVVHTAIAVAFFGNLRGRLPIEPVMAIFAAAALAAIAERLRRGRVRHSAPVPSGT